ncbi:MAG: hypothetical protein PHX09_00850 [Clostridia bacterium]|nr:hypothetical protein [Clostridia bacterium]MDD4686184.1 hypothetical protein [Clostridia bacterium]
MNKKAGFTIISLLLVLGVLAFSVYMIIQPFVKNNFDFILSDTNLDFSIDADALWASDNDKNFKTEASKNGLVHNHWVMPDIVFSSDEAKQATLSVTIVNRNLKKGMQVRISGIAFDSDPYYREEPRFISSLTFDDGVNPCQTTQINAENEKGLSRSIQPSKSEEELSSLTITIVYELLREKFDFTFSQNIVVIFDTV